MITISEKIKLLYTAINKVVAEIAVQGQINSRHKLVDELNQALANIDCGVYKPELLDTPVAELTKDAEPAGYRYRAVDSKECTHASTKFAEMFLSDSFIKEPLYTHPPAPKAITADDVTKQMVEMFENASPDELGWWGDSDRDDIIAAAVNAFNGVKP